MTPGFPYRTFLADLSEGLRNPLPGFDSQLKMSPPHRESLLKMRVSDKPVLSAVLILLVPMDDSRPGVVFIERAVDGRVHSGQIAFPGGRTEPSDATPADTALREANEEVGVLPEECHIIGELTELYVPPSNYLIYPVVGYTATMPNLVPDQHEVQHAFVVPLSLLYEPATSCMGSVQTSDSNVYEVAGFKCLGKFIWGATAMILSEMLDAFAETALRHGLKGS